MKLSFAVFALLNVFIFVIFISAVGANFFFNGFLFGIFGAFVLFLLLGWVIGLLDDMFQNVEQEMKHRNTIIKRWDTSKNLRS
jgi:cell division protein FtsX